ncbi:YggS family pyridoxal phosphate-dependent enzyme [Sphingomonas jaspsi]|uniref:YggS family pyridoxal phosphate-dependent enzyme n=1 Tax=Sphingomonas jaspsi TaxID=392409 RepID=UPI0004AE67F5|nr:YggS family pyridoxal phosphate-dependent enzyme [Sphingomonas jaspsi]
MTDAATRLDDVRDDMVRACKASRRRIDDVTLIAVSKRRSADEIAALADAGVLHFGENRVAEVEEKWPAIRQARPGLILHMVGQLQSNKAADAVRLFDVIHSLDRPSLLDALVRESARAGRAPSVYVQVNIGDEEQKGGVAIDDLPDFLAKVRTSGLPLAGLMGMPPRGVQAGPYFALLADLARRHGVNGLSMGMSDDFATAIMMGATAIRVGTALFE